MLRIRDFISEKTVNFYCKLCMVVVIFYKQTGALKRKTLQNASSPPTVIFKVLSSLF